MTGVYPQNFYYPKYEEFPPEMKYESGNKEDSSQNKNDRRD